MVEVEGPDGAPAPGAGATVRPGRAASECPRAYTRPARRSRHSHGHDGAGAGRLQAFRARTGDCGGICASADGSSASAWSGVTRADQRGRIERFLAAFDRDAAPHLSTLRTNIVHNDANDHNVLVSTTDPGGSDAGAPRHRYRRISATSSTHMWSERSQSRRRTPCCASATPRGRGTRRPRLSCGPSADGGELAVLYSLVCLRLCTSAVLSAHQRAQDPGNAYLSVSETAVWTLLARLEAIDPDLVHYQLRDACGLEPCPHAAEVRRWLVAHPERVGPVLDPDPRSAPRTTLDLSVGSGDWSVRGGRDDGSSWGSAIATRMHTDGASVAVGRYGEARLWYTAPQFRTPTDSGDEWRTIHLGVDLFAPAGTAVLAPIDGTVESVHNNAGRLDYGPTVVLRHEIPGADAPWYTLYGHLNEAALTLQRGLAVRAGDRLGSVGTSRVNGGWPPHLHLQIIADRVGYDGDFPGVARPSDRAVWLSISPDPNLILRFPEGTAADDGPDDRALLAARRERLGPSLSIAYETPLTIVRGRMQFLYDARGRRYLDGVNNVAHVGHCHPHVVAALQRQAAILNTNTRYLHPSIVRYAERLTAHLPAPLSVCFFVCSGSEANELALRLALAHTQRRDVIVVDHAYHGNTTSLVDLSPYKFDGPGGRGAPRHVHKLAMPDPYRGEHRGYGADSGRAYATEAGEVVAALARSGRCRGVPLRNDQQRRRSGRAARGIPLRRVSARACRWRRLHRRRGTDRIRPSRDTLLGLRDSGRRARHCHAGQADRERPSNGRGCHHRRRLLRRSPTAWSTSIRSVATRSHVRWASRSSTSLSRKDYRRVRSESASTSFAACAPSTERHALIGDVRGRGLFLGVELVRDREALTPAPRYAAYVVERMRERGVLLSTEGPFHTVIRLSPARILRG